MLSLRSQLAREAAALYGFVDSISALCCQIPQSVAFTEPSMRFFGHIDDLACATKKHLEHFPARDVDAGTEEDFHHTRDELLTIRRAWQQLHRFIKSAVDADTLNQPTALVMAMLRRTKELPSMETADFAIFHTEKFDYLQVNPSSIRKVVQELAFIVSADEGFPKGLGLIGIPSSQGKSFFLNCLVAHEIGEYVFAEKSLINLLQPEAEVALEAAGGEAYKKGDKTGKSFQVDTVLGWAKELFCDLFAVQLVGPCYTLAYIELFDLPNLLDRAGSVSTSTARPPIRFYNLHPSHPFRVKYQADLLKRLDWWPHLQKLDSRYIRVLEALIALDDQEFTTGETDEKRLLVEAFYKIIPEVSAQLGKVTGNLDSKVHEFGQINEDAMAYLEEGIVPSTINIEVEKDKFQRVTPSSICLVNCSACFYLGHIDKLMLRIEMQDTECTMQRVAWVRKLESWTAKALEDVALLNET